MILLQQYWWFLVSLLGALLVFLFFVQGGQSLYGTVAKTEEQRRMLLLATGRKWEMTFTTLVVFGGAFFASFPLFYSTSFGGAYWVWVLLLLCFVIQAVSYEYQLKKQNVLGTRTFRVFLILNGVLAPVLLGTAVSTFFHGAAFVVNKAALTDAAMPVISSWATPWGGLEAVLVPWNVCLGLALLFLSRTLACLYFLNNIGPGDLRVNVRRALPWQALLFLVFFLMWLGHWATMDGYAYTDSGLVYTESCKYFFNLLAMPWVAGMLVLGILLVLVGIIAPLLMVKHGGIWFAGTGTVLTVLALLLCAGWNHTCYYPSTADMQSSLTIENSSSSAFTLTTMSYVSLLIPFVLGYIVWAWRALERKPVTPDEVRDDS